MGPTSGNAWFAELDRKLKVRRDALTDEVCKLVIEGGRRGIIGRGKKVDAKKIAELLSNFQNAVLDEVKEMKAPVEIPVGPRPAAVAASVEEEHGPQVLDAAEEVAKLRAEFDGVKHLLEEFEGLRDFLRGEVRGLVSEFHRTEGESARVDERVPQRRTVTEADFKARAAILDNIEREIEKNFSSIGSTVKKQQDRADLVDKLKDL